jgi:hypothetical protein
MRPSNAGRVLFDNPAPNREGSAARRDAGRGSHPPQQSALLRSLRHDGKGRRITPEEVALLRHVGSIAFTVPMFLVASLAAGCAGRQDGDANTAANQPPYGGQGGYGAPPGGAPGYGTPPPGGYNAPPPGGYNAPPPGGYNAPPPGGYNAPPPGGYNAPPPGGYNAPPPYTPPPSGPAPGPSPTPNTTPPAPSGGGFPWPFPAPGAPPGGGGSPSPGPSPSPGGSTGAATPIDPNVANVATVPLLAFSQQEAPGMTREGPVVAAQFKEGQTLEQAIQILPGKCYTVLAVGAGISEMDISLVATTPLPGASPVLAQDQGSGASASLGGRGQCFKWSLPVGINAKFILKASRGSGIAAGQLFVK